MKKELRYALKDAFEPPNPIHREEFLRNLPLQKKSFGEFLLQQLPSFSGFACPHVLAGSVQFPSSFDGTFYRGETVCF